MATIVDEEVILIRLLKQKQQYHTVMFALLRERQLQTIRRKHRFWIHNIITRRHEKGAFHNLVRELELDRDKYHQYFRMSPEKLEYLLVFVGPIIGKQTVIRETLSAKERLVICLRFLATGETYRSLAAQYRVGVTTVSKLVPEVCSAIWETMQPVHLAMPNVPADWEAIATEFQQKWDYPHCIGCVDGKHVVMSAPSLSGSLFYNYKGTFSVVLLALVDASYKFICVDIGSYGKQADAGIFSHSNLGQALLPPNSLNLPNDALITGAEELGRMPYVVVGDEAFPLQKHVMRPYPGRESTDDRQAYNYRHSRARRMVECAFGILAARWRVYHTKMGVLPATVNHVIQATVILHNMLQKDTSTAATRELIPTGQSNHIQSLECLRFKVTRGSFEAVKVRDVFKEYFVTHPLPWQEEYVSRGLHN